MRNYENRNGCTRDCDLFFGMLQQREPVCRRRNTDAVPLVYGVDALGTSGDRSTVGSIGRRHESLATVSAASPLNSRSHVVGAVILPDQEENMPSKQKTVNAIAMLKEDHHKVKELFDRFEETNGSATKAKIVSEALTELKVHASIEEKLFYPAVRQKIEDEEGMMDEADEEHHVAKILIAELENMSGEEEHWEAKFTVLAESVRHHIKEEEGKMFREAKKTDIDFHILGSRMADLKARLVQEGVPEDAEAKMIANSGLRGDSPAKSAQKTLEVPLRRKAS